MKTILPALLLAAIASAQPSFEVASIKPNNSGDGNESSNDHPGSLAMKNVSLRNIIEKAYDLKRYSLIAPDWIDNLHFDVNARMDETAKREDIRLMMQSLLKERFQLKAHNEQKTMSAYALLPAKTGFKLKPAEGEAGGTSSNSNNGNVSATFKHISIQQLAEYLSHRMDRPVIDESAIPGFYDFALEWSTGKSADETGPSIFSVLQEKLGLRLEAKKLPVEILVVDSISRTPTEN